MSNYILCYVDAVNIGSSTLLWKFCTQAWLENDRKKLRLNFGEKYSLKKILLFIII